jgi:hypothetical protein
LTSQDDPQNVIIMVQHRQGGTAEARQSFSGSNSNVRMEIAHRECRGKMIAAPPRTALKITDVSSVITSLCHLFTTKGKIAGLRLIKAVVAFDV